MRGFVQFSPWGISGATMKKCACSATFGCGGLCFFVFAGAVHTPTTITAQYLAAGGGDIEKEIFFPKKSTQQAGQKFVHPIICQRGLGVWAFQDSRKLCGTFLFSFIFSRPIVTPPQDGASGTPRFFICLLWASMGTFMYHQPQNMVRLFAGGHHRSIRWATFPPLLSLLPLIVLFWR